MAPKHREYAVLFVFLGRNAGGALRLLRKIVAKRRGQMAFKFFVGFLGFFFVCGVFGSSLPAFGIDVCGFVQGRTVGQEAAEAGAEGSLKKEEEEEEEEEKEKEEEGEGE